MALVVNEAILRASGVNSKNLKPEVAFMIECRLTGKAKKNDALDLILDHPEEFPPEKVEKAKQTRLHQQIEMAKDYGW